MEDEAIGEHIHTRFAYCTGHHCDNIYSTDDNIHMPQERRRHAHDDDDSPIQQAHALHVSGASDGGGGYSDDEHVRPLLIGTVCVNVVIIVVVAAAGERIAFLFGEEVDKSGDIHPLFTELMELTGSGHEQSWREQARYIP
jgi:hypothetical protein